MTSEWAQEEFGAVLEVPASANDDFFSLGGNSLLAAKLAMRLAVRSGKPVSIADILTHRTPGALAEAIMAAEMVRGKPTADKPAPEPHPGEALPLSESQRWYSWAYRGERIKNAAICFPVELPDGTDSATIRRALATVTDRHDAWRMRIVLSEGGGSQHLISNDEIAAMLEGTSDAGVPLLQVLEVDGDRDKIARIVADLGTQEHARGVELGNGPSWRAVLVRGVQPAGERPSYLMVVVHHLACDGSSVPIFSRELKAACRGLDLDDRPASYRDYVLSKNPRQTTRHRRSAEGWWQDYLSEFDGSCHLPSRHQDTIMPAAATECTLPSALSQELVLKAKEYHVSASTLRLASTFILVHALYGTDDAVICMPVAGRDDLAWSNSVGMFIDCIPLRHRLRQDEPIRELIMKASADLAKALEYREYGFDRIAAGVAGGDAPGKYPLSGVVLNGGAAEVEPPEQPEPHSWDISRRLITDLNVYFTDYLHHTDVELSYRSELFTHAEGAQLIDAFLRLISKIIGDGDDSVLDLVDQARHDVNAISEHGVR